MLSTATPQHQSVFSGRSHHSAFDSQPSMRHTSSGAGGPPGSRAQQSPNPSIRLPSIQDLMAAVGGQPAATGSAPMRAQTNVTGVSASPITPTSATAPSPGRVSRPPQFSPTLTGPVHPAHSQNSSQPSSRHSSVGLSDPNRLDPTTAHRDLKRRVDIGYDPADAVQSVAQPAKVRATEFRWTSSSSASAQKLEQQQQYHPSQRHRLQIQQFEQQQQPRHSGPQQPHMGPPPPLALSTHHHTTYPSPGVSPLRTPNSTTSAAPILSAYRGPNSASVAPDAQRNSQQQVYPVSEAGPYPRENVQYSVPGLGRSGTVTTTVQRHNRRASTMMIPESREQDVYNRGGDYPAQGYRSGPPSTQSSVPSYVTAGPHAGLGRSVSMSPYKGFTSQSRSPTPSTNADDQSPMMSPKYYSASNQQQQQFQRRSSAQTVLVETKKMDPSRGRTPPRGRPAVRTNSMTSSMGSGSFPSAPVQPPNLSLYTGMSSASTAPMTAIPASSSSAMSPMTFADAAPAVASLYSTRRKRATQEQLKVLNAVFEVTFFPSTELRNQLAKELGMSPRTVQVWFQNKRSAHRSSILKSGGAKGGAGSEDSQEPLDEPQQREQHQHQEPTQTASSSQDDPVQRYREIAQRDALLSGSRGPSGSSSSYERGSDKDRMYGRLLRMPLTAFANAGGSSSSGPSAVGPGGRGGRGTSSSSSAGREFRDDVEYEEGDGEYDEEYME